MRYKKFRIENFKGIKDAELDLTSMTGANVFALVGLNESGKTTILEAVHSFRPDNLSGSITKVQSGDEKKRAQGRVPRHQIANFTGSIKVEADVKVDDADWKKVASYAQRENNLIINISDLPREITITKEDEFNRGDYVDTKRTFSCGFYVKTGKQRIWRHPTLDEKEAIWESLSEYLPGIAYYPTFIFDFPERIYLTIRPSNFSPFFRSVFQDILAYDKKGYTLEDITRRIRNERFRLPWPDFFQLWSKEGDRTKVQQIIDSASAAVTKVVFGRWNKIFREDVRGREIVVEYNIEEGQKYNSETKSFDATDRHDLYVWFEIKDGTRRFKVNDRSLGFRWFFSFLLFTQFRVSRDQGKSVLFLFDEPAANLHAAAQQKLIESFPEIATGENMLLYSTHSHYMIDPAWLEQTFIVTNRADAPNTSMVDAATLDDESLDIQAHRYRKFVNDNPNETSYFQPIVDRLEIVPSKFDYNVPSVVVEGKSDFYILEYASRLLRKKVRFLPATGSGTFAALIALGVGWGARFLFLLDADGAGKREKERYALEYGAPISALVTLDECVEGLKEIENLVDSSAAAIIQSQLGLPSRPTKKHLQRFFQESLAKGDIISLGSGFAGSAGKLLDMLSARLKSAP